MKEELKVLLIDENEKRQKFLADFLGAHALSLEVSSSFSKAAGLLLNNAGFDILIFSSSIIENEKIALLQSVRPLNPFMSIILLTAKQNTKQSISILKRGIVDQAASPDDLAAVYSAINSEVRKKEILRENRSCVKKITRLQQEHHKNIQRALELEEIYDATLENLMTALDLRDVETFGHSRTVAKYSLMLAGSLEIEDKDTLDNIRKGALLHDIGKIAIPDSILKKPQKLTAEEWKKIKLHPTLGYGLIKEIKLLDEVGNIILCHHERFDGTGYPRGLKGDQIPIEARIFSLADALDAITSYRPYRKERDFKTAKKEIQDHSGKQFDPAVVDAFCSIDLGSWEKIRYETTQIMPVFLEMKKQARRV